MILCKYSHEELWPGQPELLSALVAHPCWIICSLFQPIWMAGLASRIEGPCWRLAYFVGNQGSLKNSNSHIDASHSRQPLVKGERLVRYEVNAVMLLLGDTRRGVVDWRATRYSRPALVISAAASKTLRLLGRWPCPCFTHALALHCW